MIQVVFYGYIIPRTTSPSAAAAVCRRLLWRSSISEIANRRYKLLSLWHELYNKSYHYSHFWLVIYSFYILTESFTFIPIHNIRQILFWNMSKSTWSETVLFEYTHDSVRVRVVSQSRHSQVWYAALTMVAYCEEIAVADMRLHSTVLSVVESKMDSRMRRDRYRRDVEITNGHIGGILLTNSWMQLNPTNVYGTHLSSKIQSYQWSTDKSVNQTWIECQIGKCHHCFFDIWGLESCIVCDAFVGTRSNNAWTLEYFDVTFFFPILIHLPVEFHCHSIVESSDRCTRENHRLTIRHRMQMMVVVVVEHIPIDDID
jgi:hypothetical protein